jgi:ribose 5-phosphate isomerase B
VKIIVGADHAGRDLKNHIRRALKRLGHEVVDVGTMSAEAVDYPDYAREVAQAVQAGQFDRGVLVCGTGLGMCIAANRFPGVRAAAPRTEFEAALSRRHNDANVLCLGGRVQTPQLAESVMRAWLEADFDGGRHQRRVDKLTDPDFAAKAPKT